MRSTPDAKLPSPDSKPLLLIVDDDPLIVDTLMFSLEPGFEIITSHSRPHCIQLLQQTAQQPDVALIDLGLPPYPHRPDEGLALIPELLCLAPDVKIVVLSGQSDGDNARHARALGAVDFVAKPCPLTDLRSALDRALRFRALDTEAPPDSRSPLLIGKSPAIEKLKLQLKHYADAPFPVLIEGESGTGKEIVAKSYLHQNTARGRKPFFALNCAAISPSLVEPTLFGYAKGAFTGATASRAGYFEDAADGTLFLDEIGELPLELQAKLLRVLENGGFQRVGETQERVSRARVITATNRDLRREVKAGNFRADLYHRLSVCTVSVPPLRDMGDDKLLLLDHFRHLYAAQSKRSPFELSAEALRLWTSYSFPGNVRELRNIVIRLTAKYPGHHVNDQDLEAELDLQDDPPMPAHAPLPAERNDEALIASASRRLQQPIPFSLDTTLAETERSYIEAALRLANGNVSRAARLLGINRTTLYSRMESMSRES